MAITKPPVLPSWAEAGDKVQPSNAEIQVGWPLSSIPPSRQRFNWLLNFLANGIRYFSRRGLPDYDATETYMIGDRIIGDDGKTYRSLIDNNTGQTPSAQPTKWEEWAPSLSRLADLIQKQTYTAFTTAGAAPNFTLAPTPAITAYTAGQRFRVKFHAAGSGADVLNVSGLGNKGLKQYDTAGAKVAAVIAANMLVDVEYDGVDFLLLNRLPPTTCPTPAQFDNDTSLATTEFVQRALGNRQGYHVPATGSSFSAADAGKAFGLNGPSTYTLSSASGLPNGATFDFFAAGNGCVVQASGSDTITIKGGTTVTSLTLNSGDTLSLVRVGPTAWLAISGSAQLKFAEVFGSSLAANGYQKLPSGLIIQWGSVTLSGATAQTVTFPITFPTALVAAVANWENNNGAMPVGITSKTKISMVLMQGTIGSAPSGTSNTPWLAIGY